MWKVVTVQLLIFGESRKEIRSSEAVGGKLQDGGLMPNIWEIMQSEKLCLWGAMLSVRGYAFFIKSAVASFFSLLQFPLLSIQQVIHTTFCVFSFTALEPFSTNQGEERGG